MGSGRQLCCGVICQCDHFAVDLDVNLVRLTSRRIPLLDVHICDFLTGGDICPVLLRVDGETELQVLTGGHIGP